MGRKSNLFFDPAGAYHLSDMAVLLHRRPDDPRPAISAVFSQWINSYKRLIEGYEAPVYVGPIEFGRPTSGVPRYQPGKEIATRIELRSPDPGCNIYLAFATMLIAA